MKKPASSSKKHITILGGGLVGSLLAIYMGKRGYAVDVYERRADMRKGNTEGGRSINLAMSHRGWNALTEVGLEDDIRKIAIPMYGREIHNLDGSSVHQPYGVDQQAIYSVSRSKLNMLLDSATEENPDVHFHYEQKCERVNLRKNEYHFSDLKTGLGYTLFPSQVFGADGAFSRLRYEMQKTPLFDYQQFYLAHGYKELTIPPGPNGSWQIKKNALHIWPREDFMLIALPNLDGSFTVTLFMSFEGKKSFENLKDRDAVKTFFDREFASAVPVMPTLLKDFFNNPTSSLVTIKCFPWVHKNATLLGDASHAIVPFYGQGMNSGFEDCSVLAQLMDQHEKQGDINWPKMLDEFQDLRKPDADAISDLALKNFIEMRDWVAEPIFILRKQIEKYLLKTYPDKFMPVYSMVTFSSDIRYSTALAESKKQDAFFDKVLAIENIDKKWQDGSLKHTLEEMMKSYV